MKLFDHICLTLTRVLSVYQLSGLTLARSSANLHMENLCWQLYIIIDKKDKSPTLSSPPIIKWYKTSRSHTRNVNLISDHLILLLIAVQGYIWLPLTSPSRRLRLSALSWKKHKYTSLSCQRPLIYHIIVSWNQLSDLRSILQHAHRFTSVKLGMDYMINNMVVICSFQLLASISLITCIVQCQPRIQTSLVHYPFMCKILILLKCNKVPHCLFLHTYVNIPSNLAYKIGAHQSCTRCY